MKATINLKKLTGLIGAFLFVMSLAISQVPADAYAQSDPDVPCDATCGLGGPIACGKCDKPQ